MKVWSPCSWLRCWRGGWLGWTPLGREKGWGWSQTRPRSSGCSRSRGRWAQISEPSADQPRAGRWNGGETRTAWSLVPRAWHRTAGRADASLLMVSWLTWTVLGYRRAEIPGQDHYRNIYFGPPPQCLGDWTSGECWTWTCRARWRPRRPPPPSSRCRRGAGSPRQRTGNPRPKGNEFICYILSLVLFL